MVVVIVPSLKRFRASLPSSETQTAKKRNRRFFNDRHAGTLCPLWPLPSEAGHDDGVLAPRPPSCVRSAADRDEDGRSGSDVPKQSRLKSAKTEDPSLPERDPAA